MTNPDGQAPPLIDGSDGLRLDYETYLQSRQRDLRAELQNLHHEMSGERTWVLELGCGHGHFLTAYAERHPMAACLGVDFCADRIRRAERKQRRGALQNLRFVRAEAREALSMLPAGMAFSRVFVLFPDPWPKRRHRKNRLISETFLTLLAGVVRAGGEFFFRSDAVPYVEDVRNMLDAHPAWSREAGPAWPGEVSSVFQEKAPAFESVTAVRTVAFAAGQR